MPTRGCWVQVVRGFAPRGSHRKLLRICQQTKRNATTTATPLSRQRRLQPKPPKKKKQKEVRTGPRSFQQPTLSRWRSSSHGSELQGPPAPWLALLFVAEHPSPRPVLTLEAGATPRRGPAGQGKEGAAKGHVRDTLLGHRSQNDP